MQFGATAFPVRLLAGRETADPLDALLMLNHPEMARSWAADLVKPAVDGMIDRAIWKLAAEAGVQGLLVDEKRGGSGGSAVDAMLVFEGLGSGTDDNGLTFALASQVFAMQRAFVGSASDEQLDRWLSALLAGDAFGSFAMSEPDAGSDTSTLATLAVEQPDGSYVLNGTKAWVTLGPVCDVAIVFASTDPDKGTWGTTAFLIDAETPGFLRGPAVEKMGLRSCPFGELVLTDCRVPASAVLGRPGSGAAIFNRTVEAERLFLYAAQLGAMERVLGRASEQARTRQQGGRSIGSHQAVSHRIVDMKVRHEAARLLAYKAAALIDRGEPIGLAAALAKLQIAENAAESAIDAMRVFGASGYTVEVGLEAEVRDALGGLAYSGTVDVTRNIVAGLLHLDRPGRRTKERQTE
jgi:alkylation response protein AidB-like acyl-CoA dehydrogenase